MLLSILAEAVNAVADWPIEECFSADDPVNRIMGYAVGDLRWTISIADVKRARDEVLRKKLQLDEMLKRARPLPLRPFPADAYSRELYIRHSLLSNACIVGNSESRRQTARCITMLGRLRSLTT